MRRILIGIVVMCIAGCSQEQPGAVERAPIDDLGIQSPPSYSVSSTSGDLKLEVKSLKEAHMVEVRITNVGTKPIVAFVPDAYWSIDLVPEDDPWTYPPPTKIITTVDYAIGADYWWTLETDDDVRALLLLEDLVHGVLNDDGWYVCTLVYDDGAANGMAHLREVDALSEIGKVAFPSIEVHVVDGTATEWRPAD